MLAAFRTQTIREGHNTAEERAELDATRDARDAARARIKAAHELGDAVLAGDTARIEAAQAELQRLDS